MRLPIVIFTALAWETAAVRSGLAGIRAERAGVWRGASGSREIVLVSAGIGPRRAAQAVDRFNEAPLAAVLSVGCAGALEDGLATGQLVLAHAVRMYDAAGRLTTFHADPGLLSAARTAAQQGNVATTPGALFTSSRVLFTTEEKRARGRQTECVGVEMESGVHASFAASRGLPFAVLRVILDPLDLAIPAMPGVIRPDGTMRVTAGLGHLACHPRHLGPVFRLQRCRKRVADALSNVCRALLPNLDDILSDT